MALLLRSWVWAWQSVRKPHRRTTCCSSEEPMNRAYSVIEWKAVDEDQRIIEGIATTPKTDRMGDIVEPEGAEYTLPIPFLWQHDSRSPVGYVTRAKANADGI